MPEERHFFDFSATTLRQTRAKTNFNWPYKPAVQAGIVVSFFDMTRLMRWPVFEVEVTGRHSNQQNCRLQTRLLSSSVCK